MMNTKSQGKSLEQRPEDTTPEKRINTQSKQTPSMTGDAVQGTTRTTEPFSLLLPILLLLLYHLFHEADVVEFGEVAVLKEVGAVVLGHGLDQVLDHFIGDE